MEWRVSRVRWPSPFCSRGHFSLRAKRSDYVGEVPAFIELHGANTWGEHRVYVPCEEGYPGELARPVWSLSILCTEKAAQAMFNTKPSANILVRLCSRQ